MVTEPLSPSDADAASLDLATGQDACERLLSIDGLPPEVDAQTRQRMVELAPSLDVVASSTRSWPVRLHIPGGWSMHGASIARAHDGFRMAVQSSNWVNNQDQTRTVYDANGVARTRNFWVELSPDLELGQAIAILEHGLGAGQIPIPDTGLRDGRPVLHDGAWWIAGSIGDPEAGQPRQPVLTRIDAPWLQESMLLRSGARVERAWCPVVGATDDPLRFLAGLFPTVVVQVDLEAKTARQDARHAAPLIARRLHAATQAVASDSGFLLLAYEDVACADGGTQTVHRWVWFDSDWRLAQLSRPFHLRQRGAGRATGLTRDDSDLVVSFEADEPGVWLATVPEREVLPLLAPPLALDLAAIERHLDEQIDHPVLARPSRRRVASRRLVTAPTIVSMTMTGSNRDIIGDALRSVVDWVDWCLLIDTGIEDDTIEVARAVAGDKLIVREFPWCDDFSAARNFALASAAETGASWAVFVDSDERLALNGVDIHAVLASSLESALLVPHGSGEYTKDRFFRLPASGSFRGPTHEAFYLHGQVGGATVSVSDVVFNELPKSTERLRLKDERDRDILIRHTEAHPDQPRWFYYLGDVLQRLGQLEEAVTAFRACADLRGWDEEGGWAMYRAALCLMDLGRLEDARDAAVAGMMHHPGLADLPWLAALVSLRLGQPLYAVYWARQSIAIGHFAGIGPTIPRVGWRNPFALWEGPYDVLRFALKDMGDHAGAAEAERLYEQAVAARLAQPSNV
ncbi:MAG: hypothetical protein ACRDJC_13480 [Thermomicrobiales bacterium]